MSEGSTTGSVPEPREHAVQGQTRRRLLQTGLTVAAGVTAVAAVPSPVLAGGRGRQLHLAEDGHTDYSVCIGQDEGVVVEQAATELADYLQRITGAEFPVVRTSTWPGYGPRIVLGRENPLTRAQRIRYDDLSDDGFTLRVAGASLIITGASARGTLYGAYWLLDRMFGVRWFAPDSTHVPRQRRLRLDVNRAVGDHVPHFRFRTVLVGDANDAAYRQHNMLNGRRDQYWTVPRAPGIDTWSQYWPEDWYVGHLFHQVVSDPALWAGGQLKAMDPATRTAATNRLIELVQGRIARGEGASAAFIQEDRWWDPPDPDSLAFANQHGGGLSAPTLDMVNEVADRVAEAIPGARLEMEAYLSTFAPPTGMTVRDNVVMTVAPIEANFGHSLFGPENQQVGENIRRWCDIAGNVVLWDYLNSFWDYLLPFPNWWAMGEGIKTLATLPSAQGYFGLDAWNGSGTEFSHLRAWVISRLLWDPALDTDKLIREFCAGYYGRGADDVYEYLRLLYQSVLDTGFNLRCYVDVAAEYLTFDVVRQADTLLARAESAVRNDPARRPHVQSVRLGVDYIILARLGEFKRTAAAAGVAWDPRTVERVARFETELAVSGLTRLSEGGGAPAELLDRFRILGAIEAAPPAPPPQAAAGLPDSDWVDYQELDMYLYPPSTTIVADSRASNGFTSRMPGWRSDWGVQLNLGSLPTDGTWKVYASVAAETGTASPSATAIVLGVYPATGGVGIPVSELADGQFHEVEFPGTYQNDPTLDAWLSPPASAAIANVYIDRIFAIREG